jgi:putative heme transporter
LAAPDEQGQPEESASRRRVRFDWHSIAASAAALAIAFGLLFIAWMILRPLAILLMAIIVAETLEPVVKRLEQRMRRTYAVMLSYLGVLLVVIVGILTIVPAVMTEVSDLIEDLPDTLEGVTAWIDEQGWISEEQITDYLEGQMEAGGELAAVPLLIASTVIEFVLAVFLSLYWLIGKPGAKSLMLSMVPPDDRQMAEDIAEEVGSTMGGYVRGVVISGAILATLAFIGLTVIGVDFALPLAVIVLFGELIPIVGPIVALIPALAVAAFDSLTQVLLVLGLYLLIQLLESSVVYPQVMKRQASIPPILVVFAILAGGSVGGIIGALVAIPLTGGIRVLLLRLAVPRVQRRWGDDQPA